MFRSNSAIIAIACLALLATLSLAAGPRQEPAQYMPGTVILKLTVIPRLDGKSAVTGQSRVDAALSTAGCTAVRQLFWHKAKAADAAGRDLAQICEASVPQGTDIPALCAKLKATGQVIYAEPRYLYKTDLVPNDPAYGSQYALANIDAALAWDITTGDPNVVIAICDNAIQWDHPDLAANIWNNSDETAGNGIDDDGNGYIDDIRGWDFAGASFTNPNDADNNPKEAASVNLANIHGTHVAGCASEVANNGAGGAGIGYQCRLMPLKCSPDDSLAVYGYGNIPYGFDAIVYAADNGADIINCSWGGSNNSAYGNNVIQYAFSKGSLVVGAAGNGGSDIIGDCNDSIHHYPGDYDNVVNVAAVNSSDIKASFSNYGRVIDVSSPGVDIYSTIYNNSYASSNWSGTSMASPIVAGVAALVKSVHPSWTNTCIATHLNKTGENIDGLNPLYAGRLGTRVNAYNAVSQAALPLIRYQAHQVTGDDNGNGIAQAGESATLRLAVKNWWGDAAGVSATLASSDYAVIIPVPSGSYGAVANGAQDTTDFSFQVHTSALPHQALFTLQTNADGQIRTDSFYVQIDAAPILFVDDDDNTNNVDSFYTRAFANLGAVYDYYNWSAKGTPDSLFLAPYKAVIWSCEWTFPSLNSNDRAALRYYLNHGGKLYVSGQDVGWDLQDLDGVNPHEYLLDPAGCTDFYQNYLHATYRTDAPGATPWIGNLYGVNGDTLGNGLTSQFTQPGRGSFQFPDTFTVRAGATKIFSYTSNPGPSGGLRYENGSTKVVYTGFGYEAMVNAASRQEFMRRILKWFLGDITVAHTPLSDTEDTINSYRVTAIVTSSVGIGSVKLFYNLDGSAPFDYSLAMSRVGATDTFECYIPAQNGATIQYYIVADNANAVKSVQPASAPVTAYSFYAGPDPVAPAITHTPLANTINLNGPYKVTMTASDNYGVFTDSSYIHFRINSGAEQTPVLMVYSGGIYTGLITLAAPIGTWDTVSYYLTAVDMSGRRNVGRSPAAGYNSFVATDSVLVSNFDSPADKAQWDTTGGTHSWRTYTTASHSSPASMRTGPGNYVNNADYRMTLKAVNSYNLDAYADNGKWVRLYYWQRGRLADTISRLDTLMVEGSKDNVTWTKLKYNVKFFSLSTFIADTVDLTSFLSGKGANDSISFRFRLKSDASGANFGWLIDDVYLKVEPVTGVAGQPEIANRPGIVGLSQSQPNPFAKQTFIRYQLPKETPVKLKIYNVAGQTVRTLVDGRQPAGYYNLKWDGTDEQGQKMSAGVYLYRLDAGDVTITKKLVVVK